MRRLVLALALAAATAPAQASSPPKQEKAQAGQYVDLSPVGLPIVGDGRLVNYAFVYVRLNLAPSADAAKLRAKEPFFRDALVRLGHRTPLNPPDDYSRIDEARLKSALLREAAAIAGPGVITSVVVTSQAPQHQVASPRRKG
ncbi:MAG: hypothetical protein IT546_13950 [Caulobacteraceae bacterium]|nr:hypothetical protein [Caulobacteraceae bacterium]